MFACTNPNSFLFLNTRFVACFYHCNYLVLLLIHSLALLCNPVTRPFWFCISCNTLGLVIVFCHTVSCSLFFVMPPSYCIPGPFYEAQFGVEIFVELYILRFHHQSPPKCCKDTLPFYFINFCVVVYCYYGYLPIS